MKKVMLGLLVASVFAAGTAQAAGENDMSATLNINGSVKNGNGACTIVPGVTAVSLTSRDAHVLPGQNEAAGFSANFVVFDVHGDQTCVGKINAKQIGVKFVGTADDADGISLANDDTGTGAATGVGVGIYGTDSKPMKINSDYMTVGQAANSFGLGLVKLNGQTPVAGSVHGSLTLEVVRL